MSRLTTEQEAACGFAAGSVLVSAAAGAGKTTTLSARVVRRCLSAEDPIDIDRFLLVTFTEKAALEMRLRIASDLSRQALAGDGRAQAQLERLPLAHISTIHGFCLRLLRDAWQAAGFDPEAALMDERQAEIMRRHALDVTLGAAYAARPGMQKLVAYFGGMGEDEGLREALLKTLRFLDTLPDPAGFLTAALRRHAGEEEFRAALRLVMADDLRRVEEAARLLREAAEAARAAEGDSPYALALDSEAATREAAAGQGSHDWSSHAALLRDLAVFAALAGNSAPQRAASRRLREQAKGQLSRLAAGLARIDERELLKHVQATQAILADLVQLLLAAMDDYRQRKRERQVLDFADLELEAYRLLQDRGAAVAEGLRERFAEVLVDEFQDVNPLQAAIVSEVSRLGHGGNLFAVGDVKQSIYGFRHAAPGIFLERQAEAARRDAALHLSQNFRSRPEIIDVVNAVFRQLMQEEDAPRYDGSAELRAGRSAETLPPDPDPRVRFVFVGASESAGDADDLTSLGREADWIAAEIRRLVAEGHPVWDATAEAVRPARYSDCAVLLRGLQGAAATFDDIFALRGVPAAIQRSEGYLGGQELQTLVALLRAVELPDRDWDLLVTLRAPWFGLSLGEVLRIREAAPGGSLWQGLGRAAQREERFRAVLGRIEIWREWSLAMPLDRLVAGLLADTGYQGHVAGLPRGAQRRRDVLAFLESAEAFARQGGGGVGAFLATFEELSRQHLDLAPPDVDMGDAVRVTSIHRSKGLEFPIVFVAGLGRRIGGRQERDRIRLHRRLGMAAAYPDEDGGLHPTVFWQAIDAEERQEGLHEEIRLLYVAMTRARDRLYLTGCGEPGDVWPPLDAAGLRAARRPLDWLGAPLATEGLPVVWQTVQAGEADDLSLGALETAAASSFDASRAAAAFAALPDLSLEPRDSPPLRLSASSLAEAGQGYGAILRSRRERRGSLAPAAARAAGIHTHRLLELIDLRDPPGDPVAAVAELIARGALPAAAAQAIDLAAVGRFLASPTAARIRAARRIERELAFSVLADGQGRPHPSGGTVLQGKIDLLLEDEQGWLIVDFKTDHVAPHEVAEAAKAYRGQIDAYRRALHAIAGIEAQALLYFLAPGVAVPVQA